MNESISIRETAFGWLNKHTGRYYKSAARAQAAVKKAAADRARVAGVVVTQIQWEPTTPIGSLAVKSIA